LKAGETHQYTLELNGEDFVHLYAEQQGIDLIIKVTSEDGQFSGLFDSPNGELDGEDIYLYTGKNEKYNIEIYPAQKYADPGAYNLKFIRSAKASQTDKAWLSALSSTQKADKMRTQEETRKQSIQQYEVAMAEWLSLKDNFHYARALRSQGFVYIRLKEYDKALSNFNRLLNLWNKLGDTRAEGFTNLIIGRIYDLQKNYEQSLSYNQESLPYWRKTNDKDQESFTIMNIGNLYSYLGDKQKTVTSFEEALQLNSNSQRPSVKAVILRDYANSLMRLGEKEKGLSYYEQSLKQWQVTVNKPEEARTAALMATIYAGEKSKQGIDYYQHALDIWDKLGDKKEYLIIKNSLDKLLNTKE
jgi:tetratricopeptide (TPR) repeat protein